MEGIQQKVKSDVATRGWHVVKVLEGGVDEPPFAYTIGFAASYEHPEVVIVGLELDDMHWMLNEIGERVRAGNRFDEGARIDGLLEGLDCKFVAVDSKWYDGYFGQALAYYGTPALEALQCLWPDRDGRFPDEPGFDDSLRTVQPVLSA